MTAQAFVFFAAGFETAASTTTFVLYELALHPLVQDKLRREVDEVVERHGGHITYQALQEMSYMEQVLNGESKLIRSLYHLTSDFTCHPTCETHLQIRLQEVTGVM